jgi:hypothetical protein
MKNTGLGLVPFRRFLFAENFFSKKLQNRGYENPAGCTREASN